jgi:hypothetical protein
MASTKQPCVIDTTVVVRPAEVLRRQRAGPGDAAARMREQAELQRRQVAVADPARPGRDAAREQLPVDLVEQPGQAVTAAAGQRNRRLAARNAVQRSQPRVVVAGKTLVPRERGLVCRRFEAERAQPPHGARDRLRIAHHAGR